MKRRDVITLLGGVAASWPLAAYAQQPKRFGLLMNGSLTNQQSASLLAVLQDGLHQLGWVEGRNLRTELRWNGGDAQLARTNAAELVALAPDVIFAASTTNLSAVRLATRTIPIVFTSVSDPVVQGFVPSLMRPGGNITGFAVYEFSIAGKWLDLLKQMVPALTRVTIVFNPDTSPQTRHFLNATRTAAPLLRVEVATSPVRSVADIERAIAGIAAQTHGGMLIPTDSFVQDHAEVITGLAARHRVPAMYASYEYITHGGLMHYGASDLVAQYRGAATYVDRILKGAKPGELPVQLPTKYTLVINLKAARALGIEVPVGLLLIADEQIE